MALINLVKTESGYDTVNKDGIVKGHVYKLEDGNYYYQMIGEGIWSSFALQEMAKVLDRLNTEETKRDSQDDKNINT